ncbi:Uncharacterized protein dnm_034230 [Desulfonema magnum]|uniref:Uncharacterized protein n=1 Tax=Desulfonema magnum TaxID=45655 RepID=A0A975GN46_9BACT|nr:Uncharacterized protein dnm_034230 [Desulfonema magnum]
MFIKSGTTSRIRVWKKSSDPEGVCQNVSLRDCVRLCYISTGVSPHTHQTKNAGQGLQPCLKHSPAVIGKIYAGRSCKPRPAKLSFMLMGFTPDCNKLPFQGFS